MSLLIKAANLRLFTLVIGDNTSRYSTKFNSLWDVFPWLKRRSLSFSVQMTTHYLLTWCNSAKQSMKWHFRLQFKCRDLAWMTYTSGPTLFEYAAACYTVLAWWQWDWNMTSNWLVSRFCWSFCWSFWLVFSDCLVLHCIMGSRDQWKFPSFCRPQCLSTCTALANACR